MKKGYFSFSFVFLISASLLFGDSSCVLNAMEQAQGRGVGIESGVNGCYFNAAMQCLTNCLPAGINPANANNLSQMQKNNVQRLSILKNDILRQNGGSVNANELRNHFVDAKPDEFLNNQHLPHRQQQADAASVVTYFLDLIKESGCNAYDISMQSVTVRPECKHRSIKVDPCLSLELDIPKEHATSLAVCLMNYCKVERFNEQDGLRCGQCNAANPNGTKQLGAQGLPQILVLQLKRFAFNNIREREKINTSISFPLENFICKTVGYDNNPPMDHKYALTGFIQHSGSLDGGHYTAYIKRDGQWYICNDRNSNPVTRKHVQRIAAQGANGNATPYVFFYEHTKETSAEAHADNAHVESDEASESSDDKETENDISSTRNKRKNDTDDDSGHQAKKKKTNAQTQEAKPLYNLADYKRACESNKNLAKANLQGADLSNMDLANADLAGANLQGANLTGADLTGAILNGANLSYANLTRAQLIGAQCNNQTQFYYTHLNEARLDNAIFNVARLIRTDLTGAFLIKTQLRDANIVDSILNGAHLTGTILDDAHIVGGTACKAELNNLILKNFCINCVNFEEATLTNVVFCDSYIGGDYPKSRGFESATFISVSFFKSRIQNISMHNIDANLLVFGSCYLKNIDFSEARLQNMNIRNPIQEPHARLDRGVSRTLLGENLNFEYSTITESIFRGRRNSPEEEARIRDEQPLFGRNFDWIISQIDNEAKRNDALYYKANSLLFGKFNYAFLSKVYFSDIYWIEDLSHHDINLLGKSFANIRSADGCVFDTVGCSLEQKNDLKIKGAKVNDETAEEFRDMWNRRKDPSLGEMIQEVAAREAAAQAGRALGAAALGVIL